MRILLCLLLASLCHGQILTGVIGGSPAAGGGTPSVVSTSASACDNTAASFTCAIPAYSANDAILVFVHVQIGFSGLAPTFSDDKSGGSNTYSLADSAACTTASFGSFYPCYYIAQPTETSATTLTIAGLTNGDTHRAVILVVHNVATSGLVESGTGHYGVTADTTYNSGAPSAASASGIAIGCTGIRNTTPAFTPAATWTQLFAYTADVGVMQCQWVLASASTAYTSSGVLSISSIADALVIVLKGI